MPVAAEELVQSATEHDRRAETTVSSPQLNAESGAIGSNFDDFLAADGLLEEVSAAAIKRVIAWQLTHAMKQRGMTKTSMAQRMGTS